VSPHASWRWLLAAALTGGLSAGAALGRDDSHRQRVTGDDDPVVLPVWVAAPELTPRSPLVLRDPETTGSVTARTPAVARGCGRVAWYPERSAEHQYRELC
jgi:hypothetical protein